MDMKKEQAVPQELYINEAFLKTRFVSSSSSSSSSVLCETNPNIKVEIENEFKIGLLEANDENVGVFNFEKGEAERDGRYFQPFCKPDNLTMNGVAKFSIKGLEYDDDLFYNDNIEIKLENDKKNYGLLSFSQPTQQENWKSKEMESEQCLSKEKCFGICQEKYETNNISSYPHEIILDDTTENEPFEIKDNIKTYSSDDSKIENRFKPFECVLCKRRFTGRGNLRQHMKIHLHPSVHICSVCNKSFHWRRSLIRHKKTHLNTKSNPCSVCDKSFNLKETLSKHMKIHTGFKSFICSLCSKTFYLKSDLVRHMQIHTQEKKHPCHLCSKSFRQAYHLKRHLRSSRHSQKEENNKCYICDSEFDDNICLNIHLREHVTDSKPYIQQSKLRLHVCDICSRSFHRKSDLKRHMLIHTEEKPHTCSICGKKFRQKFQMNNHLKVHNEERRYRCSICFKDYFEYYSLKYHMKTHLNESHQCELCDKTFKMRSALQNHVMRVHSKEKPYKCSLCSKMFADSRGIHSHMLRHMSERPIKCSMCEKAFNCDYNLNRHIKRIHAEVKPHRCPVCDKTFGELHSFKRHMNIHTGKV